MEKRLSGVWDIRLLKLKCYCVRSNKLWSVSSMYTDRFYLQLQTETLYGIIIYIVSPT